MKSRKTFVKIVQVFVFMALLSATSCGIMKKEESGQKKGDKKEPHIKISLAQWSLHRAIFKGEMLAFDFAKEAKSMGFEGIEYVSTLYKKEIKQLGMDSVVSRLKSEAEKHGVKSLLIMIDAEGQLASANDEQMNKAVENHKKWVDAAAALGCHSIRVNAHGQGSYEAIKVRAVKGLSGLAEYAQTKGINVIVENHGGNTANGEWLASVIKEVNKPNCGTLPDFGNFCLERKNRKCVKSYDKYKGVDELMPYAKAVSAKSREFDADGNETTIDYEKMMQIVKKYGYSGYIGVEYEGRALSEREGILATKKLVERFAY